MPNAVVVTVYTGEGPDIVLAAHNAKLFAQRQAGVQADTNVTFKFGIETAHPLIESLWLSPGPMLNELADRAGLVHNRVTRAVKAVAGAIRWAGEDADLLPPFAGLKFRFGDEVNAADFVSLMHDEQARAMLRYLSKYMFGEYAEAAGVALAEYLVTKYT